MDPPNGSPSSTTRRWWVDALLSRLRHQCHTIRIDGPSLRDPQGQLDLSGGSEPLRAPAAWRALVNALFETDWVVYAKPAFGGAPAVLRYLGRYTPRVAISNHRLLAFDGEHVTFSHKGYLWCTEDCYAYAFGRDDTHSADIRWTQGEGVLSGFPRLQG